MSTASIVLAVAAGALLAIVVRIIFRHVRTVLATCRELEAKGWRYSGACSLLLGPHMLPPSASAAHGNWKKPKLYRCDGKWLCVYDMGHNGTWWGKGDTPREAWDIVHQARGASVEDA